MLRIILFTPCCVSSRAKSLHLFPSSQRPLLDFTIWWVFVMLIPPLCSYIPQSAANSSSLANPKFFLLQLIHRPSLDLLLNYMFTQLHVSTRREHPLGVICHLNWISVCWVFSVGSYSAVVSHPSLLYPNPSHLLLATTTYYKMQSIFFLT